MITSLRSRPRNIIVVVLVLLMGFAIRVVDIDAIPYNGDEAWIGFLAFSWGHNGQRQEMGTFSSTAIPLSPFHNDLFAVPFAFDPDPRFARLFMAMLHLVSMAALYLMARRYWSQRTALAALILYAGMSHVIYAARNLWHPHLALPFVVGYLLTGFLAAEGKPWPRRFHPIFFCCMVQAHPATVMLAPLSLAFFAKDWLGKPAVRRKLRLLADYAVGAIVAGLLLAPWIIGVIHFRAANPTRDTTPKTGDPSSPAVILDFLMDVPTRIFYKVVPNPDYVPPSDAVSFILRGIGWLTLLAALFVLGQALWRRKFSDTVLAVSYLIFPVLLLVLPERAYPHYMLASLPAAAVLQAIVLIGVRPRPVLWTRLGQAVIVVMIGAQAAYFLSAITQSYGYTSFTRNRTPSLAQMTAFRDAAVRPGYETIYDLEGFTDTEFTQSMMWQVLAARGVGTSRVIWGANMAFPIPAAGATYVGFTDSTLLPELYARRQPRVTVGGIYQAVDVPPNSQFTPTCQPQGPVRLGNGATILGYYTPEGRTPKPGQPWTIYVLWQTQQSSAHQNFQLFNHLVDEKGDRYAQSDIPSLPTDLWRENEQLVSRVTLTSNDKLPAGPLVLRLGMYQFPEVVNSPVLDKDGNPVAAWITVPVCY